MFRLEDLLASGRVSSVVCERRSHSRELGHIHTHRTLLRIHINRFKWIRVDALVFRKQHRQRLVTCIGGSLRFINLVDET